MTSDVIRSMNTSAARVSRELVEARWARLALDFARLPLLRSHDGRATELRDVGALLLLGHDEALADAERYVVEGHIARTGQVVDVDDIDDEASLRRGSNELDRASREGFAPPAPSGFWASFLRWRTPMGMARLADRPSSRPRVRLRDEQ